MPIISQGGDEQRADNRPWLVLEESRMLRKMLECQAQNGAERYTAQFDSTYRRLRTNFLDSLQQEPCLRRFRRTAARLLPVTVADFLDEGLATWRDSGCGLRANLVRLESQVLTALEVARRPPACEPVDAPSASTTSSGTDTDLRTANPNRAQLRAERRKLRALALRDEGKLIKEIAAELRCSQRTISEDLKDAQ